MTATSKFTLDDRIFCLQRTFNLPSELRTMVYQADVLYLQDRDDEAEKIIVQIESMCDQANISIWLPENAYLLMK